MTHTKRKPHILPKPLIRLETDGAMDVDFGQRRTARVYQCNGHREKSDWWYETADQPGRNCWGQSEAFTQAWSRCVDAPAPVALPRDDVAALVLRAETGDTTEAASVFRALLRLRTGFGWSVACGRGTAGAWIHIDAAPRRRVDDKMSAHDRALLATILGECPHHQGESVRPGSGVRAMYAWKLSGHEAPADLRVAPPDWD